MIDQSQQPTAVIGGGGLFGSKEITNMAELAQAITSFYGTANEVSRRECEAMLNRFQQSESNFSFVECFLIGNDPIAEPESWRLIVELVRPTNNFSPHVQFYGAKVLYTWASTRFDQLAESTENVSISHTDGFSILSVSSTPVISRQTPSRPSCCRASPLAR